MDAIVDVPKDERVCIHRHARHKKGGSRHKSAAQSWWKSVRNKYVFFVGDKMTNDHVDHVGLETVRKSEMA